MNWRVGRQICRIEKLKAKINLWAQEDVIVHCKPEYNNNNKI